MAAPLLRFGDDAMSAAGGVHALAFAPRKPLVAAIADDPSIHVWNVRTRERIAIARPSTAAGRTLAFLDDDHLAHFDGRELVRVPIAGGGGVPLALPGLPSRSIEDAAVDARGELALLLEASPGRTPVLWRADLRTRAVIALDCFFRERELAAALGIEGAQPRPDIAAAAFGDDGSVLAVVRFERAAGQFYEILARWLPTGERLVPLRNPTYSPPGPLAWPEVLLPPTGRSAILAFHQPEEIDLATGAIVRSFAAPPSQPESSVVAAGLADRGRLLVGATRSGLVTWNVATAEVRATRRFDNRCDLAAFAVSETHGAIAVADGAAVRLHSLADLSPLHAPTGHGNAISAVAVCPRGRRLASTDGTSLKMWHLPSGEPVWTKGVPVAGALHFSPDGSQLGCTLDFVFHVLDAATGETIAKAPDRSSGRFVWCSDGRLVHVGYFEYDKGTRLQVYEGPERRLLFDTPTARLRSPAAISANGTSLLVHDETRAHGWDLATRRRLWTRDLAAIAAVVSPDGTHAAVKDGTTGDVLVLEMQHGGNTESWSGDPRNDVLAWSANDRVAAGRSDGRIALGRNAELLEDGHAAAITALAFSADGSLLASGARDGSLALWKI